MDIENTNMVERLRKEYYKVMEYTQPFGNEYHEELFDWFISKTKAIAWMAYHQCMIDNCTTGIDEFDKNLPSIDENIDKVTFDKWFDKNFAKDPKQ